MINYKKSFQKVSDFFTLNTHLPCHNTRGNKLNVANVNTTIYGSNSISLKAIKQWNELQNFVKTYLFSTNDNTSSVKLTPLIKLLYGFGMYISPLYHSLVIICIYSCMFYYYCYYYYYYYYYYYLFTSFFSLFLLFFFYFFIFFLISCFYLFIYFFPLFFFSLQV